MVGKKTSEFKTHPSFNLKERVPTENLYYQLKEAINWDFLYQAVAPYYGTCGHESIDPIVFFKLMLVGHLENLKSDRAIIRVSRLRLDILYFLDYDLDEELPWHSTLSRTRQRLPADVLDRFFDHILSLCLAAGMFEGITQSVDAAYVEANACLDKMQPKDTQLDWPDHNKIIKNEDNSAPDLLGLSLSLTALPQEEKKRLRSNKTHYSPADPDARIAKKQGKPSRLYHLASLSVDTFRHVITHIQADFADERDSRHLLNIVTKTKQKLKELDRKVQRVLADGGFSSGSNYAMLEANHIEGYINLYGQYTKEREGFTYEAQRDVYRCTQGKELKNKGIKAAKGYFNYYYWARTQDCRQCPVKQDCCRSANRKVLTFTAFRNHFDRMEKRLESSLGRRMKRLRMSTVEPVFGSLLNYFGLRRINAKGKKAAHKCMVMSATAYNLKKYLKLSRPRKVAVKQLALRGKTAYNYRIMTEEIWMTIKLQTQLLRSHLAVFELCNSHVRFNFTVATERSTGCRSPWARGRRKIPPLMLLDS